MIKRSLLLVAFCLAALLPAQAQVVIKEKVEIQPDSTIVGKKLSRQEYFATFQPGKMMISEFIASKSGELQLYYFSASRLFDAIPEAAYISVYRNGAPLMEDLVKPRFNSPWQGPVFYPSCSGGSIWIDTFHYHTPTGEVVVAGNVVEGDTLQLAYTTDWGTMGGNVTHVPDPSQAAWNVELFYFEPCFHTYVDRVSLGAAIVGPELKFLRQNDQEIPQTGTDAVLMVSSFRTDENIEPQTSFESPYKGYPAFDDEYQDRTIFPHISDRYTFRPQIIGVESGKTVEFLLEVLRAGVVVPELTQRYQAVEGLIENEVTYRGDQHIRLVSNARPSQTSTTALYDDEILGKQTIQVKLLDRIRMTLIVEGETTATYTELPVGFPATEESPYAVKHVAINWQWPLTLSEVDADLTTSRMSEDWAQAGI